jgi:hypothetical protein
MMGITRPICLSSRDLTLILLRPSARAQHPTRKGRRHWRGERGGSGACRHRCERAARPRSLSRALASWHQEHKSKSSRSRLAACSTPSRHLAHSRVFACTPLLSPRRPSSIELRHSAMSTFILSQPLAPAPSLALQHRRLRSSTVACCSWHRRRIFTTRRPPTQPTLHFPWHLPRSTAGATPFIWGRAALRAHSTRLRIALARFCGVTTYGATTRCSGQPTRWRGCGRTSRRALGSRAATPSWRRQSRRKSSDLNTEGRAAGEPCEPFVLLNTCL